MRTIVIAARFDNARRIARALGAENHRPTTPLSVRRGFGRGITADEVLVDASAWPLPGDVRQLLESCLIASGGTIRRYDA